jgi:hypothetical protein
MQILAKWIKDQDQFVFWLQENHFRFKDIYNLKWWMQEKVFYVETKKDISNHAYNLQT